MNYSPLAVSPLYLYNIPMLSYRPVFRQHQSPLPKTQSLISGQLPSVSLLQRCGVDARSLAEIKRGHVPKYTSMYILGLRVCNANSLLHRTTAIHGGTEKPFANRRCRYKEIGKKVPQAYLRYVEDTFLPYDAVDAPYIYKRGGNQYC